MDTYGAAAQARNRVLLQRMPSGAAEFDLIKPWGLKHASSGLRCGNWPSMVPYNLVPVDGRGFAACIYERRDASGVTEAKGEIRVLRVPSGATIEQIFTTWRDEKLKQTPTANSEGPIRRYLPSSRASAVRHEAFISRTETGEVTTELGVAIVKEWAIEISVTYPGRFEELRRDEGPGGRNNLGDRLTFSIQLNTAIEDVNPR